MSRYRHLVATAGEPTGAGGSVPRDRVNGRPGRAASWLARAPTKWVGQAKEVLLLLPRLLLLFYRLFRDPTVPIEAKAISAACISYILIPTDFVLDFIPVIGQLDDLYVASLGLSYLIRSAGPEKLRQHWTGSEDIVSVLHSINEVVWRVMPGSVLAGIAEAFERIRARKQRSRGKGRGGDRGGPVISLDPSEFQVLD